MQAAGMAIGSHSMNHDDYANLSFDEGVADARDSQALLADLLGVEIGMLALPWGHSRPGQTPALSAIYNRLFTTRHGFNAPDDGILCRNEADDLLHFAAAASGSLDFFKELPFRRPTLPRPLHRAQKRFDHA
jgi:peptidoglycan/xylan/chitin deacetylase (PgdA/CDA1 family)